MICAPPGTPADAAAGLDIPPALQGSIERHRTHLVQLATALRDAGVPEIQIQSSLSTLIASYRSELVAVLKSLEKDDRDAV